MSFIPFTSKIERQTLDIQFAIIKQLMSLIEKYENGIEYKFEMVEKT